MRVESQIVIARAPQEVFDYIAHAEYLPEYVEDFASVSQVEGGEPGRGARYTYTMKRGGAEGSFEWTEFQPARRLAWQGPAVKAGPGSMKPAGEWDISASGEGSTVTLVMAPAPGGLFKLLAPFLAAGIRKGNEQALARLKQRLESR